MPKTPRNTSRKLLGGWMPKDWYGAALPVAARTRKRQPKSKAKTTAQGLPPLTPTVPDWVNNTPEAHDNTHFFLSTMTEDGDLLQDIFVDQEEYIILKHCLALWRRHIAYDDESQTLSCQPRAPKKSRQSRQQRKAS